MPPFPDASEANGILLSVGDWIVALGVIPAVAFVIDYGFLRPMQGRWPKSKKPRITPWWQSGIGTMFFTMGLAFFAVSMVVILSLFLGIGYPGREVVRIIGYTISTGSVFWMYIVYSFEKHNAESTLIKD